MKTNQHMTQCYEAVYIIMTFTLLPGLSSLKPHLSCSINTVCVCVIDAYSAQKLE